MQSNFSEVSSILGEKKRSEIKWRGNGTWRNPESGTHLVLFWTFFFFLFLNCVAFISKGAGRWTFLIDTTLLPTGTVLTVIRETVSHVSMKMHQ